MGPYRVYVVVFSKTNYFTAITYERIRVWYADCSSLMSPADGREIIVYVESEIISVRKEEREVLWAKKKRGASKQCGIGSDRSRDLESITRLEKKLTLTKS
jgi:hypothetical protein